MIKQDVFVLENLLMSFRVKEAKNKADELVFDINDYHEMVYSDLSNYGTDKDRISFAIKAYIKALDYVNSFYK